MEEIDKRIKWTYELVKEYTESKGYELKEYINSNEKITLIDKDRYYYYVTLVGFVTYNNPRKFHTSNPYTIQNIKLWCKLNNKPFELVSDKYNGDKQKLKWKCLKEGCGEEFKASWQNIRSGNGCGVCSGKQVGLSNCLATKRPDLAKEWHPTKNGNLTPFNVTANSSKYIWWKCSKNPKHEWKSSVSNRNGNQCGCPYCAGQLADDDNNLFKINPILCKEWDYDRNEKEPKEYLPNSDQKVWWICSKNNKHRWQELIINRNKNGYGCPYCSSKRPSEDNNLLVSNNKLALEWNYNKNINRPQDYTPYSGKYVWWQCLNNPKHEWIESIANRNSKGYNCPYCSGKRPSEDYNLLVVNPELCKEWDYSKNKGSPKNYTPNSSQYVYWKCKDCGHNWKAIIANRNYKNSGCPECSKSKGEKKINVVLINKELIKISQEEFDQLIDEDKYYKNYFIPQMKFNKLIGINGGLLSYDFYIPKYGLLIEYQGEQHERPIDFEGLGKEYAEQQFEYQQEHDLRKMEYAKRNNIKLLEIWYWEFDDIEEILEKEIYT